MITFTPDQKIAFVLSFAIVGLIFLYIAGRVLRSDKIGHTLLRHSYGGFNLLVGLGYILFALFTYVSPEGNAFPWGYLVSLPFYYIGVGYLSIFVWHTLFPKKSHNVPFYFFMFLAFLDVILSFMSLVGDVNFHREASLLAAPMAVFVPVAGLLFVRMGLRDKIAERQSLLIGSALLAISVLGGLIIWLNFVNTYLGVLATILFVPAQLTGLAGVLSGGQKQV